MNIKDIQEIELIDIDKIEVPSYKRLGTLLNTAFNSINEILFYLKERDGEKCGVSDDRYYGTVGFCQNPKGSCPTHDTIPNNHQLDNSIKNWQKLDDEPTEEERHSITDKLIYEAKKKERERIIGIIKSKRRILYSSTHDIYLENIQNENTIQGILKDLE